MTTETKAPVAAQQPEQTHDEKVEALKAKLRVQHMKTLQNFLGDEKSALKFLSAMVYSVNNNPKLLSCSIDSVMDAFMKCAELNLYPSSVSGDCFVIPYAGEAKFQLGYQGIVKLLARSSIIVTACNLIHANDPWDYEEGLTPKLYHKPDIFSDRGDPIGVYVIMNVQGISIPHAMPKAMIMKFKDLAPGGKTKDSPWNSSKDPELWMWKKTCLKQASKKLPKNELLSKAVSWDNEATPIKEADTPKTITRPDMSMLDMAASVPDKPEEKQPETAE